MKTRPTLLLLALTSLPTATELSSARTSQDSPKDEIKQIREQWIKNWNDKKLDPILRLYTQDAVFLPSTGERLTGSEKIAAHLRQVMAASAGKLSVKSINSKESGKFAFDSGTFEDTIQGGGTTMGGPSTIGGPSTMGGAGPRKAEGNYLIVFVRADNKWLIAQHASTEVRAR